jgi:hypothetical protein
MQKRVVMIHTRKTAPPVDGREDLDFLGRFDREGVLSELTEHRIYGLQEILATASPKDGYLKGTINFLTDFGASEHNLSRHKDQQNDLGVDHSVNQPGKQLGLIGGEHAVAVGQTLQPNGESNVTAPDDVLDLEIHKFGVEAEFLDDPGVLA